MFLLTNISLALLWHDRLNGLRCQSYATPISENKHFFLLCPQVTMVKGTTIKLVLNNYYDSINPCLLHEWQSLRSLLDLTYTICN